MGHYIYIFRSIGYFFPYFKSYKYKLIILCFLLILSSFACLIEPLILKYTVDNFFHNVTIREFAVVAFFYFMLFLSMQILTYIQQALSLAATNYLELNIRRKLLHILLNMEYKQIDKFNSGDFFLSFDNDVEDIQQAIVQFFMKYIISFFTLIFSLYFMFHFSPVFMVLILCIMFFVLINNRVWEKKLLKREFSRKEHKAKVSGHIQNIAYGNNLKSVHIIAQNRYFKGKFLGLYRLFLKAAILAFWGKLNQSSINEAILRTGHIFLIGLGGYLIYKHEITLGGFFALYAYAVMFRDNSANFANFGIQMNTFVVASERIKSYFNLKLNEKNGSKLKESVKVIKVKNLDFAYNEDKLVLSSINMVLNPTDKISIIGESGCGKSTFVSVVAGAYISDSITINSIPINELNIKHYRRQICYLPQETFIFGDTVREYLAMGKKIDENTLVHAAKICKSYDFIMKDEKGFDQSLIKGGANFSGGQKQRLALTRAIIEKPKLLIMDEPTSGLDHQTEEIVLKNMYECLKNSIIILISHNIQSTKYSNRIFTLKSGKLVSQNGKGKLNGET